MTQRRRQFLKLSGSAISTSALLGVGTAAASAEPDVEWRPAASSNYTAASRSAGEIDWIVLHTIQGSYEAGIGTFQNPSADVSAHYVVGREPGQITKMVRIDDVAWTAGNYDYNAAGINIEMAGTASSGFSDQLYRNVAELVEYLCEEYAIPKRHPGDRVAPCSPTSGEGGIIGHVQVPNPYDCSQPGGAGGHTDPGPYFDYDRLISAIEDGDGGGGGGGGDGGGGGGGSGGRDPAFDIGQDVVSTAAVNVRSSAEIARNVERTQPEGTVGTISNGFVTNDGFIWWWVHWTNGVGGWSVQRYLDPHDGGGGGGDAAFQIGEEVASTVDLNARDRPDLHGSTVLATVADGTVGWVQDGYLTEDGYTWWQVEWETGTTGWSVEEYLDSHDSGGGGGGGGNPPLPFDTRTDLTDPVSVTASELDGAIEANSPGSPLIGLGDTWVAVQDEYSVNAMYQAAHAVHESAWGRSTIARDKRNIYGWGAEDSDPYGGAKRFDSFEDCVWYVMGQVAELYLTPGNWRYNGPHLDGMNEYYATDPEWAEKIADHYRRIADDV